MLTDPPRLDIDRLREETLGTRHFFDTPFGRRLMVYADYTASGRGLTFVEEYLAALMESYANTHTEDDVSGRSMSRMLHQAEAVIKAAVGGDADTCVIPIGTGATGAIQKLQEILGVYVPPAAWEYLAERRGAQRPVVFIGAYEHHSNEVSWRESLARVVRIGLDESGALDLAELERGLSDPRWRGCRKIGSFSAASNVTGLMTPVHEVARILHRHDALACFDFAAAAPYLDIRMNRDPESFFDAIYLSPHKFLGGPGSCGLLLFNRRIYRTDLPPTFAAGGTVEYVGPTGQDYTRDIEAREKPGTPGTLQILRAALALQIKSAVGQADIGRRERRHIGLALPRLARHPGVEVLGDPDPGRRLAIISFNLRHGPRYLHPKLVTRLLNDLFGIQSRAGCSCAGPYGHHLLGIGEELSGRYRQAVHAGCEGLKPGWVRLSFHYTMDDTDVDYLCRAVEFLAEEGARFIPRYRFDLGTGAWTHRAERDDDAERFGLAAAWGRPPAVAPAPVDRAAEYRSNLEAARAIAAGLPDPPAAWRTLPDIPEDLVYFRVSESEQR